MAKIQGRDSPASSIHSALSRSVFSRRSSTLSPFVHAAEVNGSPASSRTGEDGNIIAALKPPPAVVKARQGSVLTKGFILKTDHYPTGRALDLELNLQGAPNFRSAHPALNVFGVAQPRIQGLKAILSVLGCRPDTSPVRKSIWFSTREEPIVYLGDRSFVLRDASDPRQPLSLSDRAENLEDIENRLKADILTEAERYGGLILTHHEIAEGQEMFPTWTAVEKDTVLTSREVWEQIVKEGWRVGYYRIPISPDRPIEDNYLDAYAAAINNVDPMGTSLLFSCGMGVVRTTFAMVAACILRRKALMKKGYEDPFCTPTPSGNATPVGQQAALALEQANAQQDMSLSLLRVTYILQNSMQNGFSQSVIELLLGQPALMDNLRKAYKGNYSVILSLLGSLDDGLKVKKLVDSIIDSCDHVVNLREDILSLRIMYSVTSMDEKKRRNYLSRAARALEKYFFIIAFASYVEEQSRSKESFSSWMKARVEIWNSVLYLRRSDARLSVFSPVSDLSAISRSGTEIGAVDALMKSELALSGGQVSGDEWSDLVIKNRNGIILRASTLLKSDRWLQESSDQADDTIRGAINFRNIPGSRIYALGQPTEDAIVQVVRRLGDVHPDAETIVWINLREEPLVYVNGTPYCLRRESLSLRNMKDYGGISASRLEVLEKRLKTDVVSELNTFGGRILLHTETADGAVIPVWEEADANDVATLREIFSSKGQNDAVKLRYFRVPITSEQPPDATDISELLDIVVRTDVEKTPIVLNCQLGRGRSTITSIIVLLIQRWLHSDYARITSSEPLRTPQFEKGLSNAINGAPRRHYHSYQVINNLLRVIRHGTQVKAAVDNAVSACGQMLELVDSIEDERIMAEEAADEELKRRHLHRGLYNLRKYFELIVFQAYLSSSRPDLIKSQETFEKFISDRPVFQTFLNELKTDSWNALKPLERVERADGLALPDEVKDTVANRSGIVLSASTILKSDFFSNLQKMSLPERIDGAPNFRQLPLTITYVPPQFSFSDGSGNDAGKLLREASRTGKGLVENGKMVCGCGMPTIDGMRKMLSRIQATSTGGKKACWTSLREEPVLYVAGRPHVLRLVDRPYQNVEATGITTDVVEAIEVNLKRDAQREVRCGDGRILLHDEVEEETGSFTIIPIWETVSEGDIMTPKDAFALMVAEGYNVDYARIPVTDEQAPLPDALTQLVDRMERTVEYGDEFIFNCQMGRGRTTTGMVAACLISTVIRQAASDKQQLASKDTTSYTRTDMSDLMTTGHEEEAYLNGDYKIILQLVGILSHGKLAKHITDRVIDIMDDVQNLRKAVFDYKVKVDASDSGSAKQRRLFDLGVNYLYRYGLLIVLANYLIQTRSTMQPSDAPTFSAWLQQHREITNLLARRSLD